MNIRILLAILFYVNTAAAQKGKSYIVKVGEVPNRVLPREAIYVLPDFKEGSALLRNGTVSTARFNYYILVDEMHFIAAGGDTLAVADPALVKNITIDSMVFYFENGYLRELFKAGAYKLAVKQAITPVVYKTRGAYDAASGASSIRTYGTINNNGQRYALEVKKDLLFEEFYSFYLSHQSNPFIKATRKNFHILFPEKPIASFIKEHKIDFYKEADLKALLQFCVE